MEKRTNKKRMMAIWSFGKKYMGYFGIAELCILVSYGIAILLPLNFSRLTDQILYGKNYELLTGIIRDYVILFLVATVFNFIYAYVWQYLNNHFVLDIKNAMFEKTIRAKAAFLSHMNSGDMMSRIDGDSDQFIHVIQRNLFHFLNSAVMCLGIIILVARIHGMIAVILVVGTILPIAFTRFCGKFTEKISVQNREISGKMTGKLYELLRGIREIKLFNANEWARKQILMPVKKLILLGNKYRRVEFLANQGVAFINLMVSFVIYGVSAYLIINNELTIGLFLAIIEYVSLLHKKFNWMLRIYLDWFGRKTSIDRVNEVLAQEVEKQNGSQQNEISSVKFDNVTFTYDDNVAVLKNVSFHIEQGQKIAIVGKSGAGKSTIISLILGLYELLEGNILINGISISDINLNSLRDKIGVVSQEIMMFEDSIRYNLSLGKDYSEEEIYKALEAVDMLSVVNSLPDGLDTIISSTSHNLSGGQKQRLSVARLLLKKAKFIILDEATSALDVETERIIVNCLQQYTERITTLTISHRLQTIRNCDVIYVLNENTITDFGTHEELLEKSKTYCALFEGVKR